MNILKHKLRNFLPEYCASLDWYDNLLVIIYPLSV